MNYFKRFLLITFLASTTICSFSQKTEFNINIYSGLFFYRGAGSVNTSQIVTGFYIPAPFTSNVYGKNPAFSISFEGQAIKKTKTNFLFGLGLSYDLLNTNVKINKVGFSGDPAYSIYDANGNTKLKNSYINVNPFIGKRFIKNKMTFDFLAGTDIGICLRSNEKGYATTTISKQEYFADNNKVKPSIDFRPRIQFKVGYKRSGIILGYSLGLTNYQAPMNPNAYSNFLRLGISYRLK